MPDPQRLTILTDLRKAAGLSLSDMARSCGLAGNQSHQTAGAWELGRMKPTVRRRAQFIHYLWDTLMLRKQPAQFETVWAMLSEEWDWEPLSDLEWQRLTSVARPTPTLAPTAPVAPAPFQAPALTPYFVGREAELTQLRWSMLDPESSRIYALVGMGGIGKTTLATALARELSADFPDGVLWAHLATAQPLDVLQTWARGYGYDYSSLSDLENRAAAMRDLLTRKQALLVLDDVPSATLARPLLPGSGRCVVLITTRNHDIAAALHAQLFRVTELTTEASVALLSSVLGSKRTNTELEAAHTICHALHCLPLAVEITAQRLVSRPRQQLTDMAQRLHQASNRLALGISDRAVRTSFLVSWQDLETELQHLFALIGVFAGRSFTVPALAYLAALEPAIAADRLFTLIALSLVHESGTDRYHQHPLLADFAGDQLGDAVDAYLRFAGYYLLFIRHYQKDYLTLETEWDNIMAAMETAHKLGQWETVAAYAQSLTDPWFTRARFSQARIGYQWAYTALQSIDAPEALTDCLLGWGQACLEQNDYEQAEKLLLEGCVVAERTANPVALGRAKTMLAKSARQQAHYEQAERWLMESYQIRTQLNDPLGLAEVVYGQVQVAYQRGDYTRAEHLKNHALAVQQANGDRLGAVKTFRLLALLAVEHKDYILAESYCLQALALCHSLADNGELASTLYSLTMVYRGQGKLAEAQRYIEESTILFERMGDRRSLALALYEASIIAEQQEEYETALATGLQSLEILRRLQDEFVLVFVLLHVGDVYVHSGQWATGRAIWREADQMALTQNHPLQDDLTKRLAI